MRVVLLYSPPRDDAGLDSRDILEQVDAVRGALAELGHSASTVHFSLDLRLVASSLTELRPDAVFNLVEDAEGRGRHIALAPALLEDMGLPFTGAGSGAMALSSNKLFAKHVMRSTGLPTPDFRGMHEVGGGGKCPRGRWIVKSLWEHASMGLDGDCVVDCGGGGSLAEAMSELAPRMGGECLAEAYVEGRECNVSLLDCAQGPVALPPAEILFEGFAPGVPRIVGWNAKWDDGSPQALGTPRRFGLEAPLDEWLRTLAVKCWQAFGLRGYARVDFRVKENGEARIIDVNANPCLSPDAGFRAALDEAGIPFASAVESILEAALERGRRRTA